MKYFFANWKMYLNNEESATLSHVVAQEAGEGCVLFPTALSLCDVKKNIEGSGVGVGIQDVYWISQGAYTGALSATLAKEAGAQYALVGHSERRYIFGEKDVDIAKKIQACDEVGLIPVLCIGETQEDLENGKRQYRLKKQLQDALAGRDFSQKMFVAYEPVWAITSVSGSQPCLPADAEDVVGWIKQELKVYTDADIPVLYGGSVKEDNAKEYLSLPSVDGLLVGSASAKADSFTSLLQIISQFQ